MKRKAGEMDGADEDTQPHNIAGDGELGDTVNTAASPIAADGSITEDAMINGGDVTDDGSSPEDDESEDEEEDVEEEEIEEDEIEYGIDPLFSEMFRARQEPTRLVQIYVADEAMPLILEQSRLTSISPYFKATFGNEHFKEGKDGIAHFPEDRLEAWMVFVAWLDGHDLAKDANLDDSLEEGLNTTTLIAAWKLGDKYDIKQFQDDMMYVLWFCCIVEKIPLELPDFIEACTDTSAGSPIQNFMMNYLLKSKRLGYSTGGPYYDDLFSKLQARGIQDFEQKYHHRKKLKQDAELENDYDELDVDDVDDVTPRWLIYMVGKGPKNPKGLFLNYRGAWWELENGYWPVGEAVMKREVEMP